MSLRKILFIAGTALGLTIQPTGAEEKATTLAELGQQLTIEPHRISVSGISSGGFMAHQFHVAHSNDLMGVGIIAGGPYHCAQGDVNKGMRECTAFQAEAVCKNIQFGKRSCREANYTGPGPAPQGKEASTAALNMASLAVNDTFAAFRSGNAIDDPRGMLGDAVILLHGSEDTLLPEGVNDALNQYYKMVYARLGESLPPRTLTYTKRRRSKGWSTLLPVKRKRRLIGT